MIAPTTLATRLFQTALIVVLGGLFPKPLAYRSFNSPRLRIPMRAVPHRLSLGTERPRFWSPKIVQPRSWSLHCGGLGVP